MFHHRYSTSRSFFHQDLFTTFGPDFFSHICRHCLLSIFQSSWWQKTLTWIMHQLLSNGHGIGHMMIFEGKYIQLHFHRLKALDHLPSSNENPFQMPCSYSFHKILESTICSFHFLVLCFLPSCSLPASLRPISCSTSSLLRGIFLASLIPITCQQAFDANLEFWWRLLVPGTWQTFRDSIFFDLGYAIDRHHMSSL